MSTDQPLRCHCNGCRQETKHRLIAQRVHEVSEVFGEDDADTLDWTFRDAMLQCLGCDAVCFEQRIETRFMGSEPHVSSQFFPPPVSRIRPKWQSHLPKDMAELLGEIYAALHSGSRRLALIGTRTLIDMLMLAEVGDTGTFSNKLAALRDKGVISERGLDVLSTALDAGSAAAHRDFKPTLEQLEAVLDVVENVLQSTHHLVKVAADLKAKIPSRNPDRT